MAVFKSEGSNFTVTYNGTNITAYCVGAEIAATVAEIDSTNLASTVAESSPAATTWTVNLNGHLSKNINDIMAKDALTTPATKRNLVITIGTSTDMSTYTWTGTTDEGAFISNYNIAPTESTALITWTAELGISGGPVRS